MAVENRFGISMCQNKAQTTTSIARDRLIMPLTSLMQKCEHTCNSDGIYIVGSSGLSVFGDFEFRQQLRAEEIEASSSSSSSSSSRSSSRSSSSSSSRSSSRRGW